MIQDHSRDGKEVEEWMVAVCLTEGHHDRNPRGRDHTLVVVDEDRATTVGDGGERDQRHGHAGDMEDVV
jgi:hypothetical protein